MALQCSTTDILKIPRLWDRTDRAWFSLLLRHPARKRSGCILSTPEPERGSVPGKLQPMRPAVFSWNYSTTAKSLTSSARRSVMVSISRSICCGGWGGTGSRRNVLLASADLEKADELKIAYTQQHIGATLHLRAGRPCMGYFAITCEGRRWIMKFKVKFTATISARSSGVAS